MKSRIRVALLLVAASFATAACDYVADSAKLKEMQATEQQEGVQIAKFDDLDFNVFTGQKWEELANSHAKNIAVHWPDGHMTTGIDVHIADLKAMFVYAPDTRIVEHPIKVVSGDWTAVVGYMEGTFTQPMPIEGGQFVQPTGNKFRLPMSTFGHWKDGKMFEEYLFWDNQSFMKQLGLAK